MKHFFKILLMLIFAVFLFLHFKGKFPALFLPFYKQSLVGTTGFIQIQRWDICHLWGKASACNASAICNPA